MMTSPTQAMSTAEIQGAALKMRSKRELRPLMARSPMAVTTPIPINVKASPMENALTSVTPSVIFPK